MNKKTIGKRIADFRKRRGVSTFDLANMIGKSQATISRIENGKQSISIQLLISIAKAVKVHPFDLLGSSKNQNKPTTNLTGCFEQALREARITTQYSKNAISEKLNRPKSYIEEIENGLRLPDENDLDHFTKFYELDKELLKELYILESHCPKLSRKFAQANETLSMCLETLITLNRNSSIDLNSYADNLKLLSYLNRISEESYKNLNSILLEILRTNF